MVDPLLDTEGFVEDLFDNPIGFEGDDLLFLAYHSSFERNAGEKIDLALMEEIDEQEFDYPVLIKAKISF